MLKGSQGSANLRFQGAARWFLLLAFPAALSLAAYDPPGIRITSQDMQAIVQCYLVASERGGGQDALAACDRQGVAIRRQQHPGTDSGSLPGAKAGPAMSAATAEPQFAPPAMAPRLLLSGTAALLALLASLLCLRRLRRAQPELDRHYYAAGESPLL